MDTLTDTLETPEIAETLKTRFWGEVNISEDTYLTLLELYKNDGGIAPIVKIAAHIGFDADVEYIHSAYGDGRPGDKKTSEELAKMLVKLVDLAEQFDAIANKAVGL